jgi:hypothetical protein
MSRVFFTQKVLRKVNNRQPLAINPAPLHLGLETALALDWREKQ